MQQDSSGMHEDRWAELERLMQVQQDAAATEQIAVVAACLQGREDFLQQIGPEPVWVERLSEIARCDAETLRCLQAAQARVAEELVQLHEGNRALHRYRLPAVDRQTPGFVDRAQ